MKAWLRRKEDPLSERAKQLNSRIADLELEIRKLSAQAGDPAPPADSGSKLFRSTARPKRSTANGGSGDSAVSRNDTPFRVVSEEPRFEEVEQHFLDEHAEPASTPEHFNDLGVRKYDLPALLRRVKNHLRGPTTSNPKLVSYLAAGSIQGLRPLRYEKRVARNRFMWLAAGLFLLGLGIISIIMKHH